MWAGDELTVTPEEDEAFTELEHRIAVAPARAPARASDDACICTPFGELRACPVHGDEA